MRIKLSRKILGLTKRRIIVALLFFLILVLLIEKNSSSVTVELKEDGFYPQQITVRKNTIVRFINKTNKAFWPASNLHPTHAIYPEFDPLKPVEPKERWQFKFAKIGRWKYHDHLNPNYTGTIIVLDGSESQSNSTLTTSVCESLETGKKQQCWDEQLEATVKQKGLDAAFELFSKLYQTDPDIPKACHGWSHILGKAAYEMFRDNKNFILKKETSYCGYGFFHGFIEQLLQQTGDVKATREFCQYASKQLKESAPNVYRNCVHGIGHGSVEVDDVKIWGNFQAMLDPGLTVCESIFDIADERRECYDGAFNAMQQNAYHGDYQLSVDMADLFKYCRSQKPQHLESCYYEFSGLISIATQHDFKKAVKLILQDIAGTSFAPRIMMKLSADFFQDDIALSDYTKNVLNCRSLPDNLVPSCFKGILLGFIAHGEPDRQYVKGLKFCKYPILSDKERETCYQWILGQSVKKGSSECSAVDEKYRHYCKS